MTEPLKLNLHADGLAAVHIAKSTEETRYYLNGVYVTPWRVNGEDGVMMVATDGRLLATYFDRDGEANRPTIIDGAFSAPLLKSGRSERSPRRMMVDGDVGRVKCVPRKKNAAQLAGITLVQEIEGTFPDWTKVTNLPEANGSAAFSWNHLVIDRVCKIAQRLNGPTMRAMDVFMPEKEGPALFTFGNSCPLCVVAMPMRGDDAKASAGWAATQGEEIGSVEQPKPETVAA